MDSWTDVFTGKKRPPPDPPSPSPAPGSETAAVTATDTVPTTTSPASAPTPTPTPAPTTSSNTKKDHPSVDEGGGGSSHPFFLPFMPPRPHNAPRPHVDAGQSPYAAPGSGSGHVPHTHHLESTETIIEEIVYPDETVRRRKLILSIDRTDEPPPPAPPVVDNHHDHHVPRISPPPPPKPQPQSGSSRPAPPWPRLVRNASGGIAFVPREREVSSHTTGTFDGVGGSKDIHPQQPQLLDGSTAPDDNQDQAALPPAVPSTHSSFDEAKNTHQVFIPRKGRIEPWYHIHTEVAIPFLIAGVGMVVAGYLLDEFSCKDAFRHLRELVVLITPLLGIKGTLEMTLAARLCTHVNLGHMDTCAKRLKAALDDMLLSQVQGILCGLIAAVFALILVKLEHPNLENKAPLLNRIIVVWVISILTAMTASLIIGSTVVLIVFSTDMCNVNPDNIATPMIACLGDVLTLVLLKGWGETFYWYLKDSQPDDGVKPVAIPLAILIFIVFMILPTFIYFALKDENSRTILKTCWCPVVTGIIISTAAGYILEKEGMRYINMNFYQPVINFVGGNLASIQYNRISTEYWRDAQLGTLPRLAHGKQNKVCPSPFAAAFSHGQHSTAYLVLLSLVIPSQVNFAMLTYFLIPRHVPDCFSTFLCVYIFACLIQTAFLMYITLTLTNFLWSRKYDPDSYVIPFVTACSDLIGTSFLFFTCYLVYGTNAICKAGYDPSPDEHAHCDLKEGNSTGKHH